MEELKQAYNAIAKQAVSYYKINLEFENSAEISKEEAGEKALKLTEIAKQLKQLINEYSKI